MTLYQLRPLEKPGGGPSFLLRIQLCPSQSSLMDKMYPRVWSPWLLLPITPDGTLLRLRCCCWTFCSGMNDFTATGGRSPQVFSLRISKAHRLFPLPHLFILSFLRNHPVQSRLLFPFSLSPLLFLAKCIPICSHAVYTNLHHGVYSDVLTDTCPCLAVFPSQ